MVTFGLFVIFGRLIFLKISFPKCNSAPLTFWKVCFWEKKKTNVSNVFIWEILRGFFCPTEVFRLCNVLLAKRRTLQCIKYNRIFLCRIPFVADIIYDILVNICMADCPKLFCFRHITDNWTHTLYHSFTFISHSVVFLTF